MSLSSGKRPSLTDLAWIGVQDVWSGAKKVQVDFGAKYRAILADRDLTGEARDRKLAELLTGAKKDVGQLVDDARGQIVEVTKSIDATVSEKVGADPLPKIDLAAMDPATPRAERLQAAALNSSFELRAALSRQEVDRLLDRAVAADREKTGYSLIQVYAAALTQGDELLLSTLEGYGLSRIQAEGSAGQRESLRVAIEEGQAQRVESKLDDPSRLLLDHRDMLAEVEPLFTALLAESSTQEFLAEGRSAALRTASIFLGDEIAGVS